MPRYTDPQSGRTIRSDEPLSDADLEEAFGGGEDSGILGAAKRFGQYAFGKGKDLMGAMQRLEQLPTDPNASWGQAGLDALTVGGAAIAPEASLIGTAVGAGGRAGGMTQDDADLLNAAAGLGTGLVQGAYRGVNLGRTIRGQYRQIAADATQAAPVTLGTPVGDALAAGVQQRLELARPAQRRAAEYVLNRLTAPGSPGMTYADLDQAYASLRGAANRGPVRAAIDRAMTDMLSPAGQAARSATQGSFRQYAAKPLLRGSGGLLTRAGGLVGAQQAYQSGRPRLAAGLGAAALLGGASPGQLMTAAGPIARAGLRTVGQIAPFAQQQDVASPQPDVAEPPESPGEPSAAPETTPRPSQPIKALPGPWGREIAAVSSLVKVPGPVIQMFMQQESGGRPGLTSHPAAGQVQTPAQGLMQITPGTFASVAPQAAELLGRRPQLGNPIDDILAGGLLLRRYLDKTGGDLRKTAAMYHGGENPAYWGPHTENYVNDIDKRWAEASKSYGAGG